MKNKSLYISSLSMLLLMAACADEQIAEFKVEKPANIEQYEYLNSYDVLKTYVNRAANPGFKLGIALSANDFIAGDQVHSLAVSNFDEMTAGNEMKYASCVADDGTMNFYNVTKFVNEAKNAGMTIYGHTLGWHSQQNMKYLNSLIAGKEIEVDPGEMEEVQDAFVDYSTFTSYPFYVMGYTPEFEDGCMVSRYPGSWYQYFVADQITTVVGQNYKLTVCIKGSAPGSLNAQFGNWGNLSDKTLSFNEEWQEVSVDYTNCPVESSFVVFQPGTFEGEVRIKWLKITHSETPASSFWTNMLTNSDCESDDVSCFYSTEQTVGPGAVTFGPAGTGADGVGRAIVVKSGNNPVNSWDTQFFVKTPRQMMAGDKYRFSMKYRADKQASCESQSHNEPGGYVFYNMFNNPTFTSEWQEFVVESSITEDQAGSSGMNTIAFNLSVLPEANTYYFDDIKWEMEESGNTIPLTPEEKKDTLTWALDNWIKGMMEATGGYVTAWDLANETVSDGGDDNGIYELQSAENSDNPSANFYWQDYLGDIDYVRILESKARKYFAEYGGNPSDLKLFINDFNLESWWDGNKKAKSLVEWIKRWEADGVTKIDGIGTQMHVSYILNEADQKAQEDAIVNMFRILAESGKLVKISELDMGIVDKAFGTGIKTENVTLEQQQKMAEFYTFIIRKYFEIIPAEQQYGITQWCATDSPADSGWRGGEPVGLWDLNYNRKPAYEGFVNGLRGTDVE